MWRFVCLVFAIVALTHLANGRPQYVTWDSETSTGEVWPPYPGAGQGGYWAQLDKNELATPKKLKNSESQIDLTEGSVADGKPVVKKDLKKGSKPQRTGAHNTQRGSHNKGTKNGSGK